MTCGHPGAVSEVTWKFLGTSDEGDSYEFVRKFPADTDNEAVSTKKIVFRGVSFTVWQDDIQRIVILPATANALRKAGAKE
jgi:hypothetical protein